MKCNKCKSDIPDNSIYCNLCGTKQIQPGKQRVKSRGNGQGSVYKNSSGTYTVKISCGNRVDKNGVNQLVRKTKSGFKTKKEAIEYIAVLKGNQEKKIPSLSELWNQYKESGYIALSKSKQDHYSMAYSRMTSIDYRKISDITLADMQTAVNEECETYYPARDMRDLLVHLYDLASIDGFVSANIARHIVLPKLEEKVPVAFTVDEQKKLWADYALGNWRTGYFLLMIYTSMMPMEVLECKKSMVDLENKCIIGAGKKTKLRKQESIVLADVIIPVLEDIINRSNGEFLVDVSKFLFYGYWRTMKKRLNLREELSAYSCRHTTATALAMADINPAVIQRVMRHANFNTTQRYIHLTSSAAVEAVNKIYSSDQ